MRRMERLVESLGVTSLSKSQVSEMAKDLDEQVEAFRTRSLDAGPYTFVAADALVLKVRENGRVVGVHTLIATGVNAEGYREILGVIFIYPKARNLTFRSLEILRGLGLGQAVAAVAEHMSNMISKETLSSAEAKPAFDSDMSFPSAEKFSPEPFGRYFPQSYLEPILLADRIAAEAARLLDQAMNSTVTGTAHIALKPELIVRQSTARHASAVAV
jgi:hypothetical protein